MEKISHVLLFSNCESGGLGATNFFNKNVEKFVEKTQAAGVRANTANTLRSLH